MDISQLTSNPVWMIAVMVGLGFLAQWLAWRIRVPAILPLLLIGLALGPLTGLADPDKLLGELLFPTVSLAVAIILFEGSINLRFTELSGIGHAVRRQVTYGAMIALAGLTLTAHWLGDLSWPLSFLFGAVTCVTGPTVVNPMMRIVRPNRKIDNLLRWEGIVVDPLGALLAVVVYEVIVSKAAHGHTVWVFLMTMGSGAIIGALAAVALGALLKRYLIPEYLQGYATLGAVLVAFALSNVIARESGLVAVTVMGVILGNNRHVHIEQIMSFKENLSLLLVSMLFIVLAARMQWPLPPGTLMAGLLIYLVAQFVVRPISVGLSTMRSSFTWQERLLCSWISPRGVVAASISALFALQLQQYGLAGAGQIVPLVFILIIATVVVQSMTARPFGRLLGVLDPDPLGVLVFGANPVARAIAAALDEQGVHVLLAGDDWDGIRAARMQGLNTYYGNPTSEHAHNHLDESGLGRLLAMSTQREMNSLTSVHYREQFGRNKVHRLRNLGADESSERAAFANRLVAPALFGGDMTNPRFQELLDAGWRIKSTKLSESYDWSKFVQAWGEELVLLFMINDKGVLQMASSEHKLEPKAGCSVTALVPPQEPGAEKLSGLQKRPRGEVQAAA